MLPPELICVAIARWIQLLRTSSLNQSWALLRADSRYADITHTQYAAALEWLQHADVLRAAPNGSFSEEIQKLPASTIARIVFERMLLRVRPPWLELAADVNLSDDDPPIDAIDAARALMLPEDALRSAIASAVGKVDLARRTAVGAAGEAALVALLEKCWPGSTVHVSLLNDGMGYDVHLRVSDVDWHLEVKATTRRGSLDVFLSRREHEIGASDPAWRLVVVGLTDTLGLRAVATAKGTIVLGRAPRDYSSSSSWQVTRHAISPEDLQAGLAFLSESDKSRFARCFEHESEALENAPVFHWMPDM